MSDTIKHITDDIFFFQKDSALVRMHCACNTVQLLWRSPLPFSWTIPPTAPSRTHRLQDLGSHIAAWYESWVKKTEEIKDRLVEFWQCTDTAFEWKKCDFRVSPKCQVVQKHAIWGGTIKCLLIAYFIGNISAKNIKMCSCMSKL